MPQNKTFEKGSLIPLIDDFRDQLQKIEIKSQGKKAQDIRANPHYFYRLPSGSISPVLSVNIYVQPESAVLESPSLPICAITATSRISHGDEQVYESERLALYAESIGPDVYLPHITNSVETRRCNMITVSNERVEIVDSEALEAFFYSAGQLASLALPFDKPKY